MTRAQAMAQLKTQVDQCKKLRIWITGYEVGSGNKVLFADNLRMMILAFEELERAK